MSKKMVAIIALVIVASLSVAGCTTNKTSSTVNDYSSFYNKAWTDVVIEKPFYKNTSVRGNDLYVGVIRNASGETYTGTISFEHVGSQAEAAHVYKETVASNINDGYVPNAFNTSADYPTPIERWQGDNGNRHMYVAYYYSPDVSSWVVEKQYIV
jgi:hypothetical protein